MNTLLSRLLVVGALVLSTALLTQPAQASGNYYVKPDSGSADDNNACRTSDDPCATINGALTLISASAHPEDSTVYLYGTTTEQVDITDPDLAGLTISGTKASTRPTINATGNSYGISLSGVDDVTIRYVGVTGASTTGIYARGSIDSHLDGLTIRTTYIRDLIPDSNSIVGIDLAYADQVVVEDNHIADLGFDRSNDDGYYVVYGIRLTRHSNIVLRNNTIDNLSLAYSADASVENPYLYLTAINAYLLDEAVLTENSISDLTAEIHTSSAIDSSSIYLNTIDTYFVSNSKITNNTIQEISAANHATHEATSNYLTGYGIQVSYPLNVVVRDNTLSDITATTSADADGYSSSTLYGAYLKSGTDVTVRGNTVTTLESTAGPASGGANLYSYYLSDIGEVILERNRSQNTEATHTGASSAVNTAVYLDDTPAVTINRNRLANFSSTSGSGTATATGLDLHYNTGGAVLNNLIYHTTSPDASATVKGIVTSSLQASPLSIYHNTLNNVTTCIDINDMTVLNIINNICRVTTSGATIIEVTTDTYDIAGLKSNSNAWFTTVGTLVFNDTSTGTMNLSDWKETYKLDKKSVTNNPRLRLADPGKKKYLHLKSKSPLINRGIPGLGFSNEAFDELLHTDWDGQVRSGKTVKKLRPDIGADEVVS